MRRWLCLCVAAAVSRTASAQPAVSTLTVEGGAEADSNVQRVETGEGLETMRVGGPVLRVGWRLDRRGRALGGGYVLGASMLARLVTESEAKSENVSLFAGDLRWLRSVGKRPVAVGAGLAYADAVPFSTDVGARTFRTVAADAMLLLRKGDDRSLSLSVGPRYFAYKPDRDFDWWGPSIAARLDLNLWEPSGGARSLELAAVFGFEARIYDSLARASACPDGAPPSPTCFAPTSISRRDRYQRAGVEVTYTSSFIGTLGYQLTVIDSNSYGQSLVRHRGTLSATTQLPKKLIGTVLATLQIDRYLDGLVVQKDLQHQEYTNLDDANRSSVQIRLARRVTEAFSLEGRVAVWRDVGGTLDTEYRRELVYFGGVYTK
ncbi:MAG: hypothetical protein M4D80_39695 [Myxococcota bacterium]|nr:hypothetical protein [Deltaproteobacteria bacterium]MDQ3341318.1 hypothetical protein [Myxococcota bacterium]